MDDRKTVIITGGNSGLGFRCARDIALSDRNCHVILACRDAQKAERARAALIEETGSAHIEAIELDVASLASVRAFAERFSELNRPLDGLVCNAGINGMQAGQTPDGFDIIFGTNHLGHFLLTHLLLPRMSPAGRVVVVSSDMHCPPGGELTWPGAGELAHPGEALRAQGIRYSFSKLCNLYFAYQLSRRLAGIGSGITANAFNPGLMTETAFAPDKSRFTEAFLQSVSDRIGSLERSGAALAQLAIDPGFSHLTGKYFDRGTEPRPSSPLSYKAQNAAELWNASAQYAALTPDETLPGLL